MKITLLALVGFLVGAAIASAIVPSALAWYSAPGGLPKGAEIQAVVNISEVIRYSTGRLIVWQLIGGGIGATAGLIFGVLQRVRSRRPVQTAPPGSHPTTPPVSGPRTPA